VSLLFDLALVSLACWTSLYIIRYLVPHFEPEQVLSNSCFCSIDSWMIQKTQGDVIPINYMLL
jgi:hypothetical protein